MEDVDFEKLFNITQEFFSLYHIFILSGETGYQTKELKGRQGTLTDLVIRLKGPTFFAENLNAF